MLTATPPSSWRTRSASLLALLGALAAPAAQAADVNILVTKADGSASPDTVVVIQPVAAWAPHAAAEPVVINQKDLRFEPYVVAMPVGSTLRLTNQDRYDHHVRAMAGGPLGNVPPASSFEFRLPPAKGKESSAEVKLDNPGSITLGCHIHGSMRGHVFVSNSPWVGVTDEKGRLSLQNLPEGAADLRLWHPDQLSEQTAKRVQIAAANPEVSAALNFSPRKRRVAPPPSNSSGYNYNY